MWQSIQVSVLHSIMELTQRILLLFIVLFFSQTAYCEDDSDEQDMSGPDPPGDPEYSENIDPPLEHGNDESQENPENGENGEDGENGENGENPEFNENVENAEKSEHIGNIGNLPSSQDGEKPRNGGRHPWDDEKPGTVIEWDEAPHYVEDIEIPDNATLPTMHVDDEDSRTAIPLDEVEYWDDPFDNRTVAPVNRTLESHLEDVLELIEDNINVDAVYDEFHGKKKDEEEELGSCVKQMELVIK